MTMILSFVQGCTSETLNLTTVAGESLEVVAIVEPVFRNFSGGKYKIKGNVTIKNRSTKSQKYGNPSLFLIINETHIARTYKSTIASAVIDFSAVTINPNASISLPTYWVFTASEPFKIESMEIFYKSREK